MNLFKNTLVPRWKSLDESWRFALVAFFTVRIFYILWSLIILSIQPLAVQNIDFSGEPLLTVFNVQNSQAYTYLREVQGQSLTFRAADIGTVTDSQTGSIWDISTGTAIGGQYKGFTLAPS
ncbi:MAG TPA: hypothetical protein VN843_29470, partial [Anaerolineales bacterium]|nr:hypothetical protein [Anaerolineales bacterium]